MYNGIPPAVNRQKTANTRHKRDRSAICRTPSFTLHEAAWIYTILFIRLSFSSAIYIAARLKDWQISRPDSLAECE